MTGNGNSVGKCIICASDSQCGAKYHFTAKVTDSYETDVLALPLSSRTTHVSTRETYHIAEFSVFACDACTTPPKRSKFVRWFFFDGPPEETVHDAIVGRVCAYFALTTMKTKNANQEFATIEVWPAGQAGMWTENSFHTDDGFRREGNLLINQTSSRTVPRTIRRDQCELPSFLDPGRMPEVSAWSLQRHYVNYEFVIRPDQIAAVVERGIPIPPSDSSHRRWRDWPRVKAVFNSPEGIYAVSLFKDGRGILLFPDRNLLPFRHDWKDFRS